MALDFTKTRPALRKNSSSHHFADSSFDRFRWLFRDPGPEPDMARFAMAGLCSAVVPYSRKLGGEREREILTASRLRWAAGGRARPPYRNVTAVLYVFGSHRFSFNGPMI
jgi:hypothetical protein